ncbi:DUF2637 domain-containing protein [Streptomyces sp. CB03238]|uniref:DUF2637 domain-containing protein n=1 Tax=Streptomyces sp. CB03238 TaxID=1907777 RepID=UPI000A1000A9|nr:DUF2637 domain-containing protein [Streptomyces sp. CB03238]ORT54725.1 hypothetical protein BKD26_34260 [Streptomyces sp. CB03238]
MTKDAAERYALAAAGAVIVALTVGGFWLSYAHLAEVAGQHGLGRSPARQWAWPATLDAFIVAGELLMLRAGLRRVTDGWAIALTATGSVGSIALNVAGVYGTRQADTVPLLDYVVAAVPPTAALLAFGVLMRQIHQLVAEPTPGGGAPMPGTERAEAEPPAAEEPRTQPVRDEPDEGDGEVRAELEAPDDNGEAKRPRRVGRPATNLDELVDIARPLFTADETPTREAVRKTIRAAGHSIGQDRLTQVMAALRPQPAGTTGAADSR